RATVPTQRQIGTVTGCTGVAAHSHGSVRAGILVADSASEGFFEGLEVGPVEAYPESAGAAQINLLTHIEIDTVQAGAGVVFKRGADFEHIASCIPHHLGMWPARGARQDGERIHAVDLV